MSPFATFCGALRYEFRMQIRRRALWIPFGFCILIILGVLLAVPQSSRENLAHLNRFSMQSLVISWTNQLNELLPVLFGVLLADRLPRDRKTRVGELLTTVPGSLSARMFGKYAGTVLATMLPIALIDGGGLVYILVQTGNFLALSWGVAAFASVVLPGLLFVGAFSIACPLFLWVPVYQFLFVGYWFWGNLLPPGTAIPTLSGTMLTPFGGYAASAFFHADFLVNTHNQIPPATIQEGIASMALLVLVAAVVMTALCGLAKRRLIVQ